MHPVHSPQLMASPTSFTQYPMASNPDYQPYLDDGNSNWNYHGSMPQQSYSQGASIDTSAIHQPSAQRTFRTHLGIGATDLHSATMSPNPQSNGPLAQYHGTPVMGNGGGILNPVSQGFSTVGSPTPTSSYLAWVPHHMAEFPVDNTLSSKPTGYTPEWGGSRAPGRHQRGNNRGPNQRRPHNRDKFDGPKQYLKPPCARTIELQAQELPRLPTNLDASEQDEILTQVNDRLSVCVFDFVAKYRFPIPLEPDKRKVQRPSDREWTEWVSLLKDLATRRWIPASVLYNGQIKQLITILESSLEMRHAAKHQSRPIKDDRNVLQLISAGTQVAKILQDATAMQYLDQLYVQTERLVYDRQSHRSLPTSHVSSLPQSVSSRG